MTGNGLEKGLEKPAAAREMLGRVGAYPYYIGNSGALVRGAQSNNGFGPSPFILFSEPRGIAWRFARQEVEEISDGIPALRVADKGDPVSRAPSPRCREIVGPVDNCLPSSWDGLRLYRGVEGERPIVNANKRRGCRRRRRGCSWHIKATTLVSSTQDGEVETILDLPSWTTTINVGKLLEYLAGPFSVAREWTKPNLDDDIPRGLEG